MTEIFYFYSAVLHKCDSCRIYKNNSLIVSTRLNRKNRRVYFMRNNHSNIIKGPADIVHCLQHIWRTRDLITSKYRNYIIWGWCEYFRKSHLLKGFMINSSYRTAIKTWLCRGSVVECNSAHNQRGYSWNSQHQRGMS